MGDFQDNNEIPISESVDKASVQFALIMIIYLLTYLLTAGIVAGLNAIAPGVIDTEMNRAHLSDEDLAALASEIPADRLGSAGEVARLALQLASSPLYMTGQIITIDGGWC